MKLKKTASGKKTLQISKNEWLRMGQKTGWLQKSAESLKDSNISDEFRTMLDEMRHRIASFLGQEVMVDIKWASDPADAMDLQITFNMPRNTALEDLVQGREPKPEDEESILRYFNPDPSDPREN